VRADARDRCEHRLDVAADQIRQRGRGAFVRDLREIDAGGELQQLHEEPARRTRSDRRAVDRARLCARKADEIPRIFHRQPRMHHEHERPPHEERDRRKIVDGVVLDLLEEMRVGHVAVEDCQQRVTVRRRLDGSSSA
jgi:hypothetical protein